MKNKKISVVLPCLNEEKTILHCINSATSGINKSNLKKLLDVPMVATAIAQSFFESIAGAKRKN